MTSEEDMAGIDVFWVERSRVTTEGNVVDKKPLFVRHIQNVGKEEVHSVENLPEKAFVYNADGRLFQVQNGKLVRVRS